MKVIVYHLQSSISLSHDKNCSKNCGSKRTIFPKHGIFKVLCVTNNSQSINLSI